MPLRRSTTRTTGRRGVFDEYFDRRAARFGALYKSDFVTRAIGRGAVLDRLSFATDVADQIKARTVLDVGCGTGPLFEPLSRLGIDVLGIDPAAAMVQLARAKAEQLESVVRVEQRGWESISADDRADLAVALGVFDYVNESPELLGRLALAAPAVIASFPSKGLRTRLRVVRYGARGVSVHGYETAGLRALAAGADLVIRAIRPLGKAGWVVHFERATASGGEPA